MLTQKQQEGFLLLNDRYGLEGVIQCLDLCIEMFIFVRKKIVRGLLNIELKVLLLLKLYESYYKVLRKNFFFSKELPKAIFTPSQISVKLGLPFPKGLAVMWGAIV